MQLNKPKSNLIFDICLPSPEAEVTVTNPSPWPCQCPTNQIPGLVPGAWSLPPPNHIFTKLHFSLSLSHTDRLCSMLGGDEDKSCINISRSRAGSELYSLLDLFMWARGVLLQRNVPPMKLLYPRFIVTCQQEWFEMSVTEFSTHGDLPETIKHN